LVEPGEGVERGAVRRNVEQAVLLHLSLNLDQGLAEPPQQRHRGRLVIDEGTAATVGTDAAAQGQHVLVVEPLLGEDRMSSVALGQVERGGDRRLRRAAAYRARIGPGAEREAERVDQDRLAGAGLAGQRAEPAVGAVRK